MDTFVIRVDGCEVGRVSGERIELGKRLVDKFSEKFEDDHRLMKIIRDGKTIVVFYISPSDNVTVERVGE
jgi:hypothetical protein